MKVPTQPEVNIGMIGHVDHGKTTLTFSMTGENTDRHSEELRRGISIRLGYADAPVYKCPKCGDPAGYSTAEICPKCGTKGEYQRSISIVDAPGHETLMATMLSGAALMDGALLLVAANEPCPQPQTREHLMALEIIGVKQIIVVQNKIDIVSKEEARENHDQIKAFVKGTIAEHAPIIPVSAHHDVNIDRLLAAIQHFIPTAQHDGSKNPRMYVARSFDINRPGRTLDKLQGGVLGGSVISGTLRVGDTIEILPGRRVEEGAKTHWEPISSEIVSLQAGGVSFKEVGPGGLIALATLLDPAMTKSDALIGRIAGCPGTLPPVVENLKLQIHLMDRVVGVAAEMGVEPIKTNEPLMISIGTATTVGVVKSSRGELAEIALKIPVCAETGQRAALSRRIAGKWRLIGYGVLL